MLLGITTWMAAMQDDEMLTRWEYRVSSLDTAYPTNTVTHLQFGSFSGQASLWAREVGPREVYGVRLGYVIDSPEMTDPGCLKKYEVY